MGYLWYLLIPVGFWLFICFSGFFPLILLRYANFKPVEEPVPIFDKSLQVVNPTWLKQRGFRGVCGIRPLGIAMAIYMSQDQKICMTVYFAGGQKICEYVSKFPGNISITTSSTIDGPVAPAPHGVLIQSFKGQDPDVLLRRHLDSVTWLQAQLQIAVQPHQKNVSADMQGFVARQFKFMLTRPWHILTIPYRYAILRFIRTGKTIQQQAQNGTISVEKLKRQAHIQSPARAA